jgi:hypothetical protein
MALFCFFLFLGGATVGKNSERGSVAERNLLISGVLFSGLFLVVGVLLRPKLGEATLVLGVIFDVAISAAVLGGITAGRKAKRTGTLFGLQTFLTLLAIAILLGFVRSKGLELANAAKALGLEGGAGMQKDEPKDRQTCEENLKSLYTAFKFYVQDWDALPPAKDWMENPDLVSKVTKNSWLHCPSVSSGADDKFGYAYNADMAGKPLKLSGKPLNELPNAANTVLLYDSGTLDKSTSDNASSQPKPGRHDGKNFVLFADGTVKAVAP